MLNDYSGEGRGTGERIRVWDPLVRIFHWSLVACVATAWITGEGSDLIHQAAGYGVLGLIALRLVWGVLGSRHARFSDFVRSPQSVARYLREVRAGHPPRFLGHNPAGGAMIVALLICLSMICGTGWLMTTNAFWGVAWVEEVHEVAANLLLVLIVGHLTGVVVSSMMHRENLVAAMIDGRKRV